MAEVVIYTRMGCGFCSRAKMLLASKGVSYEEIDIWGREGAEEEMIRRANGRSTVPQIFIGDRHVGGCDELFDLERSGKLDPLLQQER